MSDGNENKRSGGSSLLWLAYGQIAAMLGAFSLLVFLTHFFDLGLKGAIREAFEVWTEYVRPFIGRPLQWLVDQLPEALRFDVPDAAKDYASVAVVAVLSYLRADAMTPPLQSWRQMMPDLLLLLFVWPLAFCYFAVVYVYVLLSGGPRAEGAKLIALWAAPLFYLAALFAANAWLM